MSIKPIRLNLGCGNIVDWLSEEQGWVNVDIVDAPMICDLTVYPWPWEDNSVDEILASHLVEHLPDLVGFMNECYRVLKPTGFLTVITPEPTTPWFWQDPTHIRGYVANTFTLYFTETGNRYPRLPSYNMKKWARSTVSTVGCNINELHARIVTAIMYKG